MIVDLECIFAYKESELAIPRSGWVKPQTDNRLSDYIAWGVLNRAYPSQAVDRAISESDRLEQRQRLLPSRFVVYCVLGFTLFPQYSYEDVIRTLIASQSWFDGLPPTLPVPTKAALFKARIRLGSEPLRRPFEGHVHAFGPGRRTGQDYHGLHQLSLDISHLEVPDSRANTEEFRAGGDSNSATYNRIGVIGLSDLLDRTVVAAARPFAGC